MSNYSDETQNLLFEPVVSFVDSQDNSLKFINPKLMSSNFDGFIQSQTASMAIASVNAGYLFGVYEDNFGDYIYYPIVKLYKDDPLSPTSSGYHEVFYIKDNIVETASFGAASCVVVVSQEVWDEKDIGTNGWMITQGGNAIFSNVAIRGDLEATTLDVGGENGIVYDGTSITIGTDVTILGTTTTESLQVGTSPNILKISASPNGVVGEDGIYINEYNYWYTTGSFGVGGAGGSAKWNGSTLSLTGNINATSGSFTGALTASVGTIGGFTLSNESLTASTSTASTAVGISTGASAIFAGGIDTSGSTGAAFWVSRTGSVFANSASINGRIVATSGSFSGDITASSGKFVGNVGVTDGGKIYAGSNPDSGQRIFISSAGLYGYGISGVEAFALPTDGASPRIGKFSIISTGIVSQSAENANMIYGNVDGSGNVTDGIVIRGYRTSGASAAIYTVIGGNATTYDTNNGFYLEESGKFKLKGTSGSLSFDGTNLSITGTVYATSGSFTGSVNAQYIQADTGSVGGFLLSASSLTASTAANNAVGISTTASAFFAGAAHISGSTGAAFWVSNTGSVFATAASISGRISAASGTIGGFTLAGTSLTAGTSGSIVGISTTASSFFAGATSSVGDGAVFWVSRTGSVFAQSASIAGRISAASGTIGGFTLSDTSLTGGTTAGNYVGISTGASAFFAGADTTQDPSSNANFWVSRTGSVFATSGSIGAWQITSSSLVSGTNTNRIGLVPTTTAGAIAIYTGSGTPEFAPFRVTNSGSVFATSASISGRISAASGTIGGFTLSDTSLTAGTGANNYVGMSTGASAIFAGGDSATPSDGAKFLVSRTGSVFATAASVTGRINATSGTFSGPITSTSSITGGVFRTSDTGNRVVLSEAVNNSGQIRFIYGDANETTPAYITASSSDVDFYRELILISPVITTSPAWDGPSKITLSTGKALTANTLSNITLDSSRIYLDGPTEARQGMIIYNGVTVYGDSSILQGNMDIDGTFVVGTRSSTPSDETSGQYLSAGNARSIIRRNTTASGSGSDVLSIHKFNGSGTLTGTHRIVQFIADGGNIGHITVDTNGTNAPAFAGTSDYRLKDDIQDFSYATELIKNVKLRSFKWKNTGVYDVGFIAHELSDVSRELVEGEKDGLNEEGSPEYQSIMYGRMVPYIAGAVKENIIDIEKLYAKIEQLEARIIELESKIV